MIHPTVFISSGATPYESDETMYLVLTVITLATAVIVFFEAEFAGIRPLLEDYGPEPAIESPMTPQQRDAELEAISSQMNGALTKMGVSLENPLFALFRPGT